MSIARLCIDLAPNLASLNTWGRDHAALIDAQPDTVFHPIKAQFAERRAELQGQR